MIAAICMESERWRRSHTGLCCKLGWQNPCVLWFWARSADPRRIFCAYSRSGLWRSTYTWCLQRCCIQHSSQLRNAWRCPRDASSIQRGNACSFKRRCATVGNPFRARLLHCTEKLADIRPVTSSWQDEIHHVGVAQASFVVYRTRDTPNQLVTIA